MNVPIINRAILRLHRAAVEAKHPVNRLIPSIERTGV
ncbi:MAG: hypothetical protein QOI12_2586 [Alphaproteobacteria bacterium]|jgi:hypothetical protein|nr:hypothetical protein [Alphaproteobacteria bacterium]